MDVEDTIRRILAEQLAKEFKEIKTDAKLADLGADSLDFVEIVLAIEDEFSIALPDEEAEKITTVQQAIDCVKAKTKP